MVQLQLVYKLKLELQEYSKSKGRAGLEGGLGFSMQRASQFLFHEWKTESDLGNKLATCIRSLCGFKSQLTTDYVYRADCRTLQYV